MKGKIRKWSKRSVVEVRENGRTRCERGCVAYGTAYSVELGLAVQRKSAQGQALRISQGRLAAEIALRRSRVGEHEERLQLDVGSHDNGIGRDGLVVRRGEFLRCSVAGAISRTPLKRKQLIGNAHFHVGRLP